VFQCLQVFPEFIGGLIETENSLLAPWNRRGEIVIEVYSLVENG
jgi:hypothetical protein